MSQPKRYNRSNTTTTVSVFYEQFQLKKYNFNPAYQRESGIWKKKDKEFLLDTIFKNFPMFCVSVFLIPFSRAILRTLLRLMIVPSSSCLNILWMSPDVIYFILFLLFAVYKQQQFVHIDNPSVAVFEWRYYALFH